MANHAHRAKRSPTPLTPDFAAPSPKRRAKPRPPVAAVDTAERAADTLDVADIANANDGLDDAGADDVADDVDQAPDDRRLDVNATSDGEEDADVADAGDDWQAADNNDAADEIVEDDAGDDETDETDETDDGAPDGYTASQPGEPDYYATLGIAPDAPHDELRQTYRRLAKLWHPDRYVSAPPTLRAQAERRMRALNAAYFVVGDSIRRHLYDQRRAELAALAGKGAANGSGYAASRNGYRATADTTDYTGYTAWSGASQGAQFEHASENPNGAGIFFGALALVVGLGLFISASQSGSSWVFVFGGVILVGLIALTLIFSSQTSPFANAANRLMEGEPQGFGDPYVAAGWRGVRYADRPPRRATGARKGAGARRHPIRNAPGAQAPADATPGPGAQTPPHAGEASPIAPDATGAPTDETSVAASADAQPPEASDEAAAFARFQQYVVEAVEALPAEFRAQMGNIVVRVADEPDAATLRKMRTGKGHTLFGLYEGVPLTMQGATLPPPEIVTIYRGPITRACQGDPARIREQARRTVFHEVAHHFGIDHDEMPAWVK